MADPIVIQFGPGLRRRVSSSGKERYTVDVIGEPLVFKFEDKAMEQAIATAMASTLRAKVEGITTEAAPATLKARQVAAKALTGGKPWAKKKYSGGKLGLMPPTGSTRAFNDSGRFAKSIVAGAAKGKWIVNVAANRFDAATGNVARIWSRLVSLVPEFANHAMLFQTTDVSNAVKVACQTYLAKAPATRDEFTAARAKALMGQVALVLLKAVA